MGGNLKQVVTIVLSIIIFQNPVSVKSAVGMTICTLGKGCPPVIEMQFLLTLFVRSNFVFHVEILQAIDLFPPRVFTSESVRKYDCICRNKNKGKTGGIIKA